MRRTAWSKLADLVNNPGHSKTTVQSVGGGGWPQGFLAWVAEPGCLFLAFATPGHRTLPWDGLEETRSGVTVLYTKNS